MKYVEKISKFIALFIMAGLFTLPSLGATFREIQASRHVDYNNSFGIYTPVIGNYNSVRAGAVDVDYGDSDPLEPEHAKNALYTQIVAKAFNVDIISFDNDNKTPIAWSGDLTLSIVELSSSGDCSESTSLLSDLVVLNFSNEKYKSVTVTPTKASRNALFKMQTATASICSRDTFAIRPATFNIDSNEAGLLVGNHLYNFTFTAAHEGAPNTPSSNYTQEIGNSIDKLASMQLKVPAGCTLPIHVEDINLSVPFVDGEVSVEVLYPNVGSVEFKLSDNEWTVVSADQSKGDCIDGSAQNSSDDSGRVGCLIQGSKSFHFFPEKFTSTLSLENGSNDKSFTYLSNQREMSAPLKLNITATLYGGGVATNYTAGCFSRNIYTTLSLIVDKTLSNGTSQTRINFFDDLDVTSHLNNQILNSATFLTTENKFINGSSNVKVSINFQRNQTAAENPFTIAKNDFNITQVIDTNGVQGSDFNRTNDVNATFVYGRTNASRQRYGCAGLSCHENNANIYFESFCFGATCNRALLPNGASSRKINDARWYINDNHTSATDGNVTIIVQKDGTNIDANDTVDADDNPTGNPSTTRIRYDMSKGYPYKTTIQNEASPWLIYNESDPAATRNEFQVEFNNAGVWSGKYDTETTTKNSSAKDTNRRIIW